MSPSNPPGSVRADTLSLLTAAPPDFVKNAAEEFIPLLGKIDVLANRTGLVMLPYSDTARGTAFFLGEVLVAEAHILCPDQDVEGYALVIGRDVEQAMAIAVLDAAGAAGLARDCFDAILAEADAVQVSTDEARRRDVEATRVQMETF